MRRIIVFLLCLVTVLGASAQSIPQVNAVPWYQFNRKLSVEERLRLPLDTLSIGSGTARDTSGLIAYKNGKVYFLKNSVWTEVGTGALSGDTLYVINGPSSSNLDTLARVPVSGDSLIIKSVGLQAGTFVSVTKSVGIDSIKWVAGIDTAAAGLVTYIQSKSRAGLTLTTTGTSGAATYNSATGVLNIPQYTGGGGSSGLPSFYDGLDTAQINWRNIRNWYQEFADATNGQISYLSGDSARIVIAAEDSLVIGRAGDNSITKFRNMHPSGDSVLYIDNNYTLRNKLLPDPNILVANAGTGQNLWYDNSDTLTFKRLQSTYALTASSATDSSLRYTIDTTLMATKQWATTYGFGGGGGGGTPGGSNTQVQYNSSGSFAGDAGFTYNDATNTATLDSLYLNRKIRIGSPPLDGFYNADVSIAFDASGTNAGLSIYNSSGTRILSILENGGIQWPQIFNNFSTLGLTFLGNNTKTFDANAIGGGLTPVWRYQSSTLTATSSQYFLEHIPTYAPISDVAGNNIFAAQRIRPTINQTGSNDNVTTGLLIDPILTSAPNWRAIQTTSTSNFFGRIRQDESAQVTTTDATTTTVGTIVLDTAGVVTEVDWTIKAEDGSGNIAVYKRLVRVKNVSGTLTILGTPDVIGTDFEDAGISSASIAFDVSGTSLRARATGIAATTINWRTVHTRRHL